MADKLKIIFGVILGLFLLTFFINFWPSGTDSWLLLGGAAFVTLILAGPLRWAISEKISDKYIRFITVVGVLLLLSALFIIALSTARLKETDWYFYIRIGSIGVVIGTIVVLFLEEYAMESIS